MRKYRGKSVREIREYHSPFHGIFFKTENLLWSEQSAYQKVEIVENGYYGRILLLDGLVQTTEKDEFFYHEMLVHPAFVSHPSPKKILIIGGGDGGTLKEILHYPVEEVWFVEIDSQVIEVSRKFFPWFEGCLKDKRVRLVIGDGNQFIRKTGEKFDVVLVDSSEPIGPSRVLHERDFYTRVKECLNREGVVISQIGSPLHHLEHIREIFLSLRDLFAAVRFYLCPVPTYPGGSWCFVYLSDDVDPLSFRNEPALGLKYFTKDVYRSAFALPRFMLDALADESEIPGPGG